MTSTRDPHLLILEPDPRGHTREWIEHIVGAILARPEPPALSLALPRELASDLARRLTREASGHVRFITLSCREKALCMHPCLSVSAFARWWLMRRHLRLTRATHGLFLELDHLSLPLAFGLGTGGPPVSGVLFRPSVHYAAIGSYQPTPRERLRDLRKGVLYRLMLSNPALRAVLSLDPYFPDFARRRYRNGHKVAEVPDPACPATEPRTTELALAAGMPEGRMRFVLFGELTARKGPLALLDALSQLPADVAGRIAILLAGRVDPPLQSAIAHRMEAARRTRPELWLHLENRRLSVGEIVAVLRSSDVVLAPYHRFVGSSGILLWAAQMRRPVLCQDFGLLGRLIRDHGLGVGADTADPQALAGAIGKIVRAGPGTLGDPDAMAAYAAAHVPEDFARVVLARALEDESFAVEGPSRPWKGRVVFD